MEIQGKSKKWQDHTQEVDRGWAWVIVFITYMCQFIIGGFSFTTGVFYVEFLDVFKESKGKTAWISSLHYGVSCFAGPVASLIISRKGCRCAILCGTFISSTGMFITAFAHDIYVVFITFGIIAGFGIGLVFTATIVAISYHFQRYRTFAMGITIAGGSTGTIVYPWISRALIETFAWRGALMICSGINLHLAIAAMLVPMKSPLEPRISASKGDTTTKSTWRQTLHLQVFKFRGYNLICMNCLFFTFGLFVMYTHISAYALSLNLGQTVADSLISLLGISGLIGRIILGAVGQLQCVNVPILFLISYAISGLAALACGILTTAIGLTVCTFICGLFAAAYGPLFSEVVFAIAGPKEFTHAYGYLLVYQGVGIVLGPPVAGMLYDLTQFYPASFFLGGCTLVFSAIIMVPYACFPRYTRDNKEGVEEQDKDKAYLDHVIVPT